MQNELLIYAGLALAIIIIPITNWGLLIPAVGAASTVARHMWAGAHV